jgi:hypothetical protein
VQAVDRAGLGIRYVDCMGNPESALSDTAARRSSTIERDVGTSVAVCRIAEGGDQYEMIDRLGCHRTDGRLLVGAAAVDRQDKSIGDTRMKAR